ncbi:MAG: hypothetical protein KHY76_06955 [Butyricicoccus pullicaecorum]|nr:hypothetical protein [Butyricicoccus pullicaecorum]
MTKETLHTIPFKYISGQDSWDDYIAEQLKAAADSISLNDDVKCSGKLSSPKIQESKNERI